MYVVSPDRMKNAEKAAAEKGSSYIALMENAGAAAAAEILTLIPDISGKSALILCGKGNNGGDGFVIARILEERGAKVTVAMTQPPVTETAKEAYQKIADSKHIRYCDFKTIDFSQRYDVIADAIFGTGFKGSIPEDIAEALSRLSAADSLKIAVDIPSGANSSDGSVSSGTMAADLTVTFGAIKEGMLLSPAREYCGEIVAADIGIDDDCFGDAAVFMDNFLAAKVIPVRGDRCHKGNFGKLLICAGSEEMSGAAAMNTLGALRSGAGLVKLASVPAVIDRVAMGIYECTFLKLTPTEDGHISAENLPKIFRTAENMTCISAGSGLSDSPDTKELICGLIAFCGAKKIPLVLDADGLNCIAGSIDIIRNAECSAILTPHPAELGRLLGISTEEVMADRLSAAKKLSELTGAVVAAKGFPTYIVSPDGQTRASYTGNGGLSRGGSGDVLTGIISGLLCSIGGKKDDLFEAASAGVYVFGLAADIAAESLSMTGMLPTDAADCLTAAYKSLGR